MKQVFFSADFNQFFMDLAANNHKDWFDANRKRYETSVKKPFEVFVQALIDAVRVYEPALEMRPSDAIFRINKDVRFSKDKTPYKLNRSALVSAYGRKDATHPSLYIELGPEKVMIAGGSYFLEKEPLQQVREYIAANIDEWYKLTSDAKFKKTTGGIKGEVQKRLTDKALNALAVEHPVLLQKQFYYDSQLSPDAVTSPGLLDAIMERYVTANPVSLFLQKALQT